MCWDCYCCGWLWGGSMYIMNSYVIVHLKSICYWFGYFFSSIGKQMLRIVVLLVWPEIIFLIVSFGRQTYTCWCCSLEMMDKWHLRFLTAITACTQRIDATWWRWCITLELVISWNHPTPHYVESATIPSLVSHSYEVVILNLLGHSYSPKSILYFAKGILIWL